MLRLAHRGDHRRAGENTLAAFGAALTNPRCDGIELDVRLSRDGVPVVIHDDTLRRVQSSAGRVDELAQADLAAFGVPSLADVLAVVPHATFLDVELKVAPSPALIEVLEAGRGPALVATAVSSFEPETLAEVGERRPAWPRWLNALTLEPAIIGTAAELGCSAIAVDWRSVDARSVRAVAAAGLGLAAWTVRRRTTVERLRRLGLVAVCVEGPALDA